MLNMTLKPDMIFASVNGETACADYVFDHATEAVFGAEIARNRSERSVRQTDLNPLPFSLLPYL